MLHRNAAHTRLGKKPSASQAFQQLPRAQTDAHEHLTRQLMQTQPGATTAAEGPAGTSSTTCTSLIPGGPPSPSPLSSTIHPAVVLPQQAAPTTMGEAPQKRRAQQAPHYSIKHGNEQAGSSSLQLGGGFTPASPAPLRCSLQPASSAKLGTQHMLRPARDLPSGAGYEQAKPAMNPLADNNKGGGSTPAAAAPAAARCTLQPTIVISLAPHMHRPARVLPFGAGYEQAKPAMDPQHATTKQLISDDYEKLQECAQASEARQLSKLGKHVPNNMPAREGMGQQQLSHEKGDLPKKNPPGFFGARRQAKAVVLMQQTHDPTTSTMPSFLARSLDARDPPLGAEHEQPKVGTVGPAMGQSPLEGTPMSAARRRQGQQLDARHGTPSRRPQAAPPFPLTPAGEVIQPPPPALPPEAWPFECNTNKAKHPKRDKVFLNTTHC